MPETPKRKPLANVSASVTPETESEETPSSKAISDAPHTSADNTSDRPPEFGGQKGLEPTRYGDWEKNGRCTDF